jgi:hypothetical protein
VSEKPTRTYDEPHDRLTRICAAMTDALVAHPEHEGDDRCVVFLSDGERGGMVTHGYEDDDDQLRAWVDVFSHLRAILRANGKDLALVPMQDPGNQ